MGKKKIEKLIKKYESELWRSQYKKSALEVIKNNLSKYGYWDLGYFDGRASLYEDIIGDLEELLEKENDQMGVNCKSVGKQKSMMKKMENQLEAERKAAKEKREAKKKK